ncbi:MAG: hypothetical protein JWM43_819 [Acidobacteriaceae bacterium]|nr:hypothetical protein [Acidobacteriaceae bacterium]
MLSVGFFTAALYYIYTRRFLPLAGIMLVGTFNRETTLFLIGLFILDAASTATTNPLAKLRQRFDFRIVSWSKVGVLLGIWLAVKLTLAHIFAHNDASENYVRIIENLARLKPRLWPSLLNVCGYLLPIVLVFRHGIRPVRFANYLYILPVWFAVMFYTGVIVETRIYGGLCSLVAVSMVLIIE